VDYKGWVFKVIGGCYVSGIMDGKMMEAMDRGKVQAKTIHLV